jgi:hypothetical protein
MKLSRFLSALGAVSLCATSAVAQNNEDLKKQLDSLKAEVAALKAEKTSSAHEESVEVEVNRLSERLAAATSVDSKANKITLTGEFRFRSYLELGDNGANVERDGWFNDSRVRLGFGYDFSRDVSAYAELQTNFVFGDSGVNGQGNDVGLYQAWVKTSNLFGRPEFSAKWGRQEVVLGNQFQFGNADWYNGVTFDGTRYDWSSESFDLTGMWLRTATLGSGDANQGPAFGPAASNGDGHDHDEFYTVYFTLKTIKNHKLDLYWIYANLHLGNTANSFSGNLAGATAYFHTLGARIGGNVDVASGLDWNLEAAYQTGDADAPAANTDVENLAIEGEVGVMFNKENKIRAWLRGLYAEGPDTNETGYLPLFPNAHSNTANFRARYGSFDVFPMTNVFALTGGVHFDPAKDWTIGVNGVWGETETDNVGVDDTYGFEIDVWAEYRYSEAMTFAAGVAFLFPDDQLAGGTFNDDTQFLFYMQARLFF